MRLSNPRQSLKSKYPDIWETLSKIQHALRWNDAELASHLGLTFKQFQNLYVKKAAPNLHAVTHLIEKIGLSPGRIVTGEIDYAALSQHVKGNVFHLPERYTIGALSKRRTSINLLRYLEDHFDWKMKRNVLNHFQVTEAVFSNPDEDINFLFPADLCEYLLKSGYSSNLFPLMGAYSFVTNKGTDLGNRISQFQNPKKVYEGVMLGLAGGSFDRNCHYQFLKINEEECFLEAVFTEELKDSLHLNRPGNEHACAVRGGTFSSLVGYLNLPFSETKEIKCVHRGDPSCVYHLTYGEAHQLQKERKFASFN